MIVRLIKAKKSIGADFGAVLAQCSRRRWRSCSHISWRRSSHANIKPFQKALEYNLFNKSEHTASRVLSFREGKQQ
jgi:hypothetical protein